MMETRNAKYETRNGDVGSARHDARVFPLGLCLAAMATVGVGIAAVVMGVQWGAASPRAEILDAMWLYVNVCVTVVILCVWPAMRMRGLAQAMPSGAPAPLGMAPGEPSLVWDLCTLAVAFVPALAVAAWASDVAGARVWQMVVLQLSFSVLAMGTMTWWKREGLQAWMTLGLLMALVGLPLAAYVQADFFPAAGRGWFGYSPLLAIYDAAHGESVWGVAAFWGAIGIIAGMFGGMGGISSAKPQNG